LQIKALVQSLKSRIDEIKANPEPIKDPSPENEEKKDNILKDHENKANLNLNTKKEKDEVATQTSHKSKSRLISLNKQNFMWL